MVVVRERVVGPRPGGQQRLEPLGRLSKSPGPPRLAKEREVEDEVEPVVPVAVVADHPLRVHQVDLAHRHLRLVGVEHPAELPHDVARHLEILVTAWLAVDVVAEVRIVADALHRVDPEPVDAPVEPESEDVRHGPAHLRVQPVEVGLLGQERVQVALPGGLVERPGRHRFSSERELAQPVVRRFPIRARVGPDVPVPSGIGPGRPRLQEPGVAVGGVVRHEVDHDPRMPRR